MRSHSRSSGCFIAATQYPIRQSCAVNSYRLGAGPGLKLPLFGRRLRRLNELRRGGISHLQERIEPHRLRGEGVGHLDGTVSENRRETVEERPRCSRLTVPSRCPTPSTQ